MASCWTITETSLKLMRTLYEVSSTTLSCQKTRTNWNYASETCRSNPASAERRRNKVIPRVIQN